MGRVRKTKQRSNSARRARQAEAPSLMEALVLELHNVMTDMAVRLGATPPECQRALERAVRQLPRKRPSQAVIRNDVGLSNLLAKWRQHHSIPQPQGSPKVLSIKGRRVSLEHLAKKFLPDLSLPQVVQLICAQAEVIRLKGGKVALVGNPANIVGGKPTTALAWAITQMRHLAGTQVHNFDLQGSARSIGRFERMVYVPLGLDQFNEFAQTERSHLQDVANKIELRLERAGSGQPDEDKAVCGLYICLFRDDEKLG